MCSLSLTILQSSNPAQTPSSKLTDMNILSALTGFGDVRGSGRSNDANVDNNRSKLFTPIQQNILSPANK